MKVTIFLSSKQNNRRAYEMALRSLAEVIREHMVKLYLFSDNSAVNHWRRSIRSALAKAATHYWGAHRKPPVADVRDLLSHEGLESEFILQYWFRDALEGEENLNMFSPYREHPEAVNYLVSRVRSDVNHLLDSVAPEVASAEPRTDILFSAVSTLLSDAALVKRTPEEQALLTTGG